MEKGGRSAYRILRLAAKDRLPRLLELKYERMKASPFGYFRGAVPVMAHDLGGGQHTGIFSQICGDAHLRNLGAYAGLDGRLVFDINDFDETIRGPFEWDVKRMATSIHLTGREANESESNCRDAVRVFTRRYRKSLHLFAAMPVLELARYQIHRHTALQAVEGVFAKAERSTPTLLRDALTEAKPGSRSQHRPGKKAGKAAKKARKSKTDENGETTTAPADRRFRSEPPLLDRLTAPEAEKVLGALPLYQSSIEPERRHLLSRYRALDVAFKIVGTGSVGLRDFCVYFEGNGPDDPLFLQVKQEVASAWAPYLPGARGGMAGKRSAGERVVDGQRAMQIQSDPFLGHTRVDGRDFLVRQLNDHKGSVNLGTLDLESLCHYADLCGELLARGHARSGDPDSLAGYLGHGTSFEKAIAAFARRYADQTEHDWEELRRQRRD